MGQGIAVLDDGPRSVRGRGGLGFLFPIFTMANAVGLSTMKCFRFVWENLIKFQFGKCIVGKLDSLAFLRIYLVSRSQLGFVRN